MELDAVEKRRGDERKTRTCYNVMADRDARRSDGSDKYKGVREQYITEHK